MQSTNRPLLLPANHPNSKIPSVSQHFFKYIYYCKSTDYKFPFQKAVKLPVFGMEIRYLATICFNGYDYP